MSKKSVGMILVAALAVPSLSFADKGYVGLEYANLQSEDADMGNFGFSVGANINKTFSIEGGYAMTVSPEDLGSGVELNADVLSVFGAVRSEGKVFGKAKLGVAKVDFEMEASGFTVSDTASGLAYGFGFGARLDKMLIEAEYTILPELDKFNGVEMNADNRLLGIRASFAF